MVFDENEGKKTDDDVASGDLRNSFHKAGRRNSRRGSFGSEFKGKNETAIDPEEMKAIEQKYAQTMETFVRQVSQPTQQVKQAMYEHETAYDDEFDTQKFVGLSFMSDTPRQVDGARFDLLSDPEEHEQEVDALDLQKIEQSYAEKLEAFRKLVLQPTESAKQELESAENARAKSAKEVREGNIDVMSMMNFDITPFSVDGKENERMRKLVERSQSMRLSSVESFTPAEDETEKTSKEYQKQVERSASMKFKMGSPNSPPSSPDLDTKFLSKIKQRNRRASITLGTVLNDNDNNDDECKRRSRKEETGRAAKKSAPGKKISRRASITLGDILGIDPLARWEDENVPEESKMESRPRRKSTKMGIVEPNPVLISNDDSLVVNNNSSRIKKSRRASATKAADSASDEDSLEDKTKEQLGKEVKKSRSSRKMRALEHDALSVDKQKHFEDLEPTMKKEKSHRRSSLTLKSKPKKGLERSRSLRLGAVKDDSSRDDPSSKKELVDYMVKSKGSQVPLTKSVGKKGSKRLVKEDPS